MTDAEVAAGVEAAHTIGRRVAATLAPRPR
jgi:hypothetical protein